MTSRETIRKALVCAFLLPTAAALAQQNKIAVQPPAQVAIKRGASGVAKLHVMTLPGFHVNSDNPGGEYTIPLTLKWADAPLQTDAIKYPKPEELTVGNEKLSVFTGSFTIETEFKAPASAAPGPVTVTGKIHYQACNTQMCFRPSTLEVHLPVVIE